MKKNEGLKTHFPWKKCLIATVVILLCAFIVLTLLYSIVNANHQNEKYWIFLLVWGIVFGLMLFIYWLVQIGKYIDKRKDEK